MARNTIESLQDVALAEEDVRHAAAKAAIRARASDILQLERLVTQLKARGFHVAASVTTSLVGIECACKLKLLLSATRDELRDVLAWCNNDGVEFARQFEEDIGDSVTYTLKLSQQSLRLQVFLHSSVDRAQSKIGLAA